MSQDQVGGPAITPTTLTPAQVSALFDILTHVETYSEIEFYKKLDGISQFGHPFAPETIIPAGGKSSANTPQSSTPGTPGSRTPAQTSAAASIHATQEQDDAVESETPIIAMLLNNIVLTLPGIRKLPADFWRVKFQGLIWRLENADLSESYDKGTLGLRKNVSTLASSIYEMIGRGMFGGVKRSGTKTSEEKKSDDEERKFDHTNIKDLEGAWDGCVQELVYGDLMDKMFDHLAATHDFEGYSPMVEAASRYSVIHLAGFIHYVFVISPEGQYLLKLIENVNGLFPYKMVKQTLRIANPSLMINGMMRIFLTKLSVASITNWVGLTSNSDDGMNLLQRIISMVLSWDANDFKKSADKIGKDKKGPTEPMLAAIKKWTSEQRADHEATRAASREKGQSIITAIFNVHNPELNKELTESQHTQCLQYLSAMLSARDREAISSVLCRQPPDLLTSAIKDGVAAYDPTIREVYVNVDLKLHLESLQGFIEKFIKTSKPKKGSSSLEPIMPSVADYVNLLNDHRALLYKWFHDVAKSCPELWNEYRAWAIETVRKFSSEGKERTMEERLAELFASLDEEKKKTVLAAVDEHAEYIAALKKRSEERLQLVTDATSSSSTATASSNVSGDSQGPGVYLTRWQHFLDDTLVTPETSTGQVRHGNDVKRSVAMGKTGVAGAIQERVKEKDGMERPDVDIVITELGSGFVEVLKEAGGMKKKKREEEISEEKAAEEKDGN